MVDQDDWTCNANGAVDISIVQPGDGKLKAISSFQPEFTYPIFGDEETIFGYKGLVIKIRFAAHDLKPNVHISYNGRFKAVDDIAALDLNKALKPFLPAESFAPFAEYQQAILSDESAKDFKPPGKLVHSYTKHKRNYEIWAGSLADPDVRAIVDRIQTFTSLFIEAGTPIEINDFEWTLERWTVYFVYEKLAEPPVPFGSPYSFAGYATTYRWYFYHKTEDQPRHAPDSPFPYPDPLIISELPARLRIAQFLIISPHQRSGHGAQLYRTVQKDCLDDPTIFELTIEDPNEAFDDLRDSNDYRILQPVFVKHNITINPDPYPTDKGRRRPRHVPTKDLIPTSTLNDLRAKYKIAPTQFAHIVEMYLLAQIPKAHRAAGNANMARLLVQKSRAQNENDRRYYWWRMLVKQRLYKRHRDMLMQVDLEERVSKLDETLQNVEEGYEDLLQAFARYEARGKDGEEEEEEEAREGAGDEAKVGHTEANTPSKERTKRKYVVFEEDDDEDENENENEAEASGTAHSGQPNGNPADDEQAETNGSSKRVKV